MKGCCQSDDSLILFLVCFSCVLSAQRCPQNSFPVKPSILLGVGCLGLSFSGRGCVLSAYMQLNLSYSGTFSFTLSLFLFSSSEIPVTHTLYLLYLPSVFVLFSLILSISLLKSFILCLSFSLS